MLMMNLLPNSGYWFGISAPGLTLPFTVMRRDPESRMALARLDDLAVDPGVFVELVDGTESMVAIGNYNLTVLIVS